MEGGGARGISGEKGRTIAFGILNVKSDCTQQRKLSRGDTHAWGGGLEKYERDGRLKECQSST